MPRSQQPVSNPLIAITTQLRDAWLSDVRQYTEMYLRSSGFLVLMRHGLGAMTASARLFFPPWLR